jgi:hypothetical protein
MRRYHYLVEYVPYVFFRTHPELRLQMQLRIAHMTGIAFIYLCI